MRILKSQIQRQSYHDTYQWIYPGSTSSPPFPANREGTLRENEKQCGDRYGKTHKSVSISGFMTNDLFTNGSSRAKSVGSEGAWST